MSHRGTLYELDPQHLDLLLARAASERWRELLFIGPEGRLSENPDNWDLPFRGNTVYRIGRSIPDLLERILNVTCLESLAIAGFDLDAHAADLLATRSPRLTSLEISNNRLGEGGARSLAAHLHDLKTLAIRRNRIGAAGARAIAEHLSQLTTLHIGNNDIGTMGSAAIANLLPRLTTLHIGNNDIGQTGAKVISQHLSQLTSLEIGSNNIGLAGVKMIVDRLSQLSHLEIGFTEIGKAGAKAIAENLSQLISLNVRYTNIGEAGAKVIADRLPQLTSLNIWRANLGRAGAQAIAQQMARLTHLDIGSNNIGDAGTTAIAKNLPQLVTLNISDSKVGGVGAKAIADHLSQLVYLDAGGNQIGESGAKALAQHLAQLNYLYIEGNDIGEGGAEALAQKLSSLTHLDIANNNIGEAGAKAIAQGLSRLASLNIGKNNIGEAGAKAIAAHLTQLTILRIRNSNIGNSSVESICGALPKLTYLDLSENMGISDARPLARLSSLITLGIARTSITDLSPFAERIIGGLPVRWENWRRHNGIHVEDCPLVYPSPEIARQGPEAVRNYFREIAAQGSDRLYEAKVLLVGEGGAGKTSLLRRLYCPDLPLPAEDESTRGIDIHRHEFIADDGRVFRLNVWDFGGQQIYHATHQFFLTRSSLYVLVDDTRTNDRTIHDKAFKFWLEVVETLTDGSPVLIFQNEKSGRSKLIDEAGMKGRFPNFRETHKGDLDQPGSAAGLRKAIEYFAQQLPHVGDEVPAKWIPIRQNLESESEGRPYISLEEYFQIYGRHLPFDRTKALLLSGYLHNLGAFLHFQDDPLLRKTVILQNRWATEAVFRILDDEIVKQRFGRFSLSDCQRLWSESRYADMHPELLGLMEKFELCYRLVDVREPTWMAPQLLSPSKPPSMTTWPSPADLVVGYRYSFLPRGLVGRLMVRMHRFVRQLDLAWAHGALFEQDDTQVLVEATAKGNEIELRARGPESKALLSVLTTDLEALNDSFRGLRGKVEKWVPCLCAQCQKEIAPSMYEYAQLVRRKRHGKSTIECPRSYADVGVLELLDGLRIDALPKWANSVPTPDAPQTESSDLASPAGPRILRIFLASSSELADDRDDLELYLRQWNDRLRADGLYLEVIRWENFLDAMSETRLQDEYNKAIETCDVFLSLLLTKTGKYTEEEFDVAHARFKATRKPQIFTYFKDAQISLGNINQSDLRSLWAFQEKLSRLGHFFTKYKDIEHLKLQFSDQIEKLREERKV